MEFLPYNSKPVTRMAFQITSDMFIQPVEETQSWVVGRGPEHDMEVIYFKAHETPVVGDWVVRLTADDTYHCTDAVFRERNIVPEISTGS